MSEFMKWKEKMHPLILKWKKMPIDFILTEGVCRDENIFHTTILGDFPIGNLIKEYLEFFPFTFQEKIEGELYEGNVILDVADKLMESIYSKGFLIKMPYSFKEGLNVLVKKYLEKHPIVNETYRCSSNS